MKIRNVVVICMMAMLIGCSHAGVWHNTSGGDGIFGNEKVVETVGIATPAPEPVAAAEPAAAPVEIKTVTQINETIFFDFDSSVIPDGELSKVDKIAKLMIEYPETLLILDGYASKEGTDEYNLQLSNDRADAVKAELMSMGVTEDRIAAGGKGETDIFDLNVLSPNRRVMVLTLE